MPSEITGSSTRSNSSISSVHSDSSTLVYSHTPFNEYIPIVRELCQTLWVSAAQDFEIERLRGGSYDRIIGITAPDTTSNVPIQYILRIPRFTGHDPERELAIHRYVQEHTSIPTAEILYFDLTSDNLLERPYVVQKRIPGNDLYSIYALLTHEQKKNIVGQWGQILIQLQAIKNETAGLVEAREGADGSRIYKVCRFHIDSNLIHDVDDVTHASDRTILCMLLTQFKRWLAYSLQLDSEDILSKDYYAQLSKIAQEMDKAGLFVDGSFYLTHLDLEPRNVLVEVGPDNNVSISGVLDWDSAVFAPIFASCKPPAWIWTRGDYDDDEDEDERKANHVPEKSEQQELKQVFEETMGPAYLQYAYQHQYRMARFVFRLAREGLRSSWAIKEAERLFKEWAEFTGTIDSPDAFIGVVADSVAALGLDQSDCDDTEVDGGEDPIDRNDSLGDTKAASVSDDEKHVNEELGDAEIMQSMTGKAKVEDM
ncbi:MAG: hypothetical protein L6R39_002712 [Caloplaca ligustica]|nr:MAG: hypothetical protein L6R39_002712 [Caloplaca ligustica]